MPAFVGTRMWGCLATKDQVLSFLILVTRLFIGW